MHPSDELFQTNIFLWLHYDDVLARSKNKIDAYNAKHIHSMLISKDGLSNHPIEA